jgi:putative transcriptional regulator
VSHPSPDLLLSFAIGRADLPHRVMLEAHLAGCAACRAAVAETTVPAAALLRGLPQDRLPGALWDRLRQRIEDEGPRGAPEPPALAGLPLPAAARAELPPEVLRRPSLHWRWGFTRGARMAVMARDPATHSILLIAHMPPRRVVPRHLHLGPEDVAVLTGGYEDDRGHYEAGEYAAYEPGTSHEPVTEAGAPCWTLTRLEKPNRFFGWPGLLVRLLS